jgi:DNA helicase-2/ATP-dependent DNA helicase PcrA
MNQLTEIFDWLRDHQETADRCIADAGRHFLAEYGEANWFSYQTRKAQEGLLRLSKGQDYAYDQPTSGFVYALWYQGLRINTSLTAIGNSLRTIQDGNLRIFDLGAGTGALQIAVGLLISAMKDLNQSVPGSIRIVNIDTSPFMLDFNRRFLWPKFREAFGECNLIQPEYEVTAWRGNHGDQNIGTTWVAASYLFDYRENIEHLSESFRGHLETLRPQRVFLSTAKAKALMLSRLSDALSTDGFNAVPLPIKAGPFGGPMNHVGRLRSGVEDDLRVGFTGLVKWQDENHYWCVLEASNPELISSGDSKPREISLFEPPLKIRRDVVLNEEQKEAARNTGRPTLIKGPAGCGKSIIITERIKNLIDERRGRVTSEPLRILLTTFNQGMTKQLKDWLEDILLLKAQLKPQSNITNPHYEFHSQSYEIYVMHFDILATRLWRIDSNIPRISGDIKKEREYHESLVKEIVEELRSEGFRPPSSRKTDISVPRFILEEYQRVIFAHELRKQDDYLFADRPGRDRLNKGGPSVKFLWESMKRYVSILDETKRHSFTTYRSAFLKGLKTKGGSVQIFTHVFVDEFQDCTQADFQILYALLKDPSSIVIAGDFAQSVHLGTSADVPRRGVNDKDQSNFKHQVLGGSYRLPYWTSKAVRGLSEHLGEKNAGGNQVDLLHAYKAAPPGARPLVVFAGNPSEMAQKIKNIYQCYELYQDSEENPFLITIMEKDSDLCRALNQSDCPAHTDTILRLKGLEKPFVVWSTKAEVTQVSDVEEFVYTILTRTSCLLIIALYPDIQQEFLPILKALNQPDLNFWDEESEDAMRRKTALRQISWA